MLTQPPEEIATEIAKAKAMCRTIEHHPDGRTTFYLPDDWQRHLPEARQIVRECLPDHQPQETNHG